MDGPLDFFLLRVCARIKFMHTEDTSVNKKMLFNVNVRRDLGVRDNLL